MSDAQKNYRPINFMRFIWLYFAISLLVIIPGVVSLARFGLKPAIDFTGGALIEIIAPPDSKLTSELIRASLPPELDIASIQPTNNRSILIRTSPMTKDQNQLFQYNLASNSGLLSASDSAFIDPATLIEELRFESIGPTLGKELLNKTLFAVAIASIVITLYVTLRFNELKYGISAILAMLHDSLVILGVFSLLGHFWAVEVDTLFVTALLTILSFSVHDTIVVYDRIRESRKLLPKAKFVDLINKAITETLSRSINNSMTIIFMLLALYLMGGESTKWFVFALLVGTISGTYSSTFTAAPLLIVWEKLFSKK